MLTTTSTPFTAPVPRVREGLARAAVTAAELEGALDPVPCAARPSTRFAHSDGPCRCFFGGPAPRLTAAPVALHWRS